MELKKNLMLQAMKLMSDPRMLKLMQDERFMKLMMAAMSVPGKVQTFTDEQKEAIIEAFGLSRREEVESLQRTVRSLEEQISSLSRKLGGRVGADESGGDEEYDTEYGDEDTAGERGWGVAKKG